MNVTERLFARPSGRTVGQIDAELQRAHDDLRFMEQHGLDTDYLYVQVDRLLDERNAARSGH